MFCLLSIMYFKKKLKTIIKTLIFEKYEKFEYCALEFFTNLTENKNEGYKIFKRKLTTVKKKLETLINKNKKDNENYSAIYSSLISIKKKVATSNDFYKEFKNVLEKIKKISINVDYNEIKLLKLIKISSTNLKDKKPEIPKKITISLNSDNSLFNSKKSISKEKSIKNLNDESALLIDENLNGLVTERLENNKNKTLILDETLKVTPEQNNKSFMKFQNSHKIKNFSPIKKKKNFMKVNSMMNFNNYSSVKRKKKLPRRISKASINLKKTDLEIESQFQIEVDTSLLKNDIYSKNNKTQNNYNTIYSKIKNSNRNQRSRKKKMTSKRKTLVLPNKTKLGSLSRRPSQNRDRNAYLKTHQNNLNSKSDYTGLKIDEEQFEEIIRKEILKKSQRVNFNGNQFLFGDVIEKLKEIIGKPLTNVFLIDLRRNNIEFSSSIEEDIEDFKNFNVKIIF